jgi:CheY-like chemotaxis protein
VAIDSVEGQGTTVRLTFPAAASTAAATEARQAAYSSLSRLRILVVDDDPLILKSLRDTLETEGHVVVTASGGQTGIDAFCAAHRQREPFAVVITDLGMPYVDGRKVANAVKAESPATPVIMLTGWGQRLLDDGDTPDNVDWVLSKPPQLRHLREALAGCCARLVA